MLSSVAIKAHKSFTPGLFLKSPTMKQAIKHHNVVHADDAVANGHVSADAILQDQREAFYTFFNMPKIVHEDALEDILGVQHIINEIIFNQRSRTVYVFYIRNLPKGTFTRLQGKQDDIPEGLPQYNSDGNKIHTDEESD